MTNGPNDEVSDTTDDAQRTGRWLSKFSPGTVVLKSQIVRGFALAILHLLTLYKCEKR